MIGRRFGLLSYPGIANLGDTIQSIAARRFLPQVDALIERERISARPDRPVSAILNGWFMHAPQYWPAHPDIEPLLLSMHFAEPGISRLQRWARTPLDRMLTGAGADFLRRWGPVGARDHYTLEQLRRRDIPAYHSGCLTLTLRLPPAVRGDVIVACDLSVSALAHLRSSTTRPILAVSHLGGESLGHTEQHAAAFKLLATYAGAAAVVTTRIHAAMPCLALNTPVLLLHGDKPSQRVGGVAGLMHSCSEKEFLAHRHDFDLDHPPANPEAFRLLVAPLEQRCRQFTGFDQASQATVP